MPSPYQGNPTGLQVPSPAPGPGIKPTVSLPGSGDSGAPALAQGYSVEADFLAHLNTTALWRPPRLPASGGQGFTAVTRVGTGPSTGVAPVAVSSTQSQPTYTPYNFVFKIMVGGVVGTATFQVSLDGGATYGATTTTAATYVEPTSGVTVAFTGTLVTADTYSFSGTDTDMGGFADTNGLIHGGFDHFGYPRLGRLIAWREDWWSTFSGTASQSPIAALPRWSATVHNGVAWSAQSSARQTYPGRTMRMFSGTTVATDGLYVATPQVITGNFGSPLCLDYFFGQQATTNLHIAHGMPAPDPFNTFAGGLTGGAYFIFRGTNIASGFFAGGPDTNWQAVTDDTSNTTIVNTGIAPTLNDYQFFSIEIIPSLSGFPGAPITRFFINGKLVAITTTRQPLQAGAAFGVAPSAAASSNYISVGEVQFNTSATSVSAGV